MELRLDLVVRGTTLESCKQRSDMVRDIKKKTTTKKPPSVCRVEWKGSPWWGVGRSLGETGVILIEVRDEAPN